MMALTKGSGQQAGDRRGLGPQPGRGHQARDSLPWCPGLLIYPGQCLPNRTVGRTGNSHESTREVPVPGELGVEVRKH